LLGFVAGHGFDVLFDLAYFCSDAHVNLLVFVIPLLYIYLFHYMDIRK
jgi:hypothetical protein